MTESVTIGRAILHLGDCREVLGALEGFDAIVTDPPYGLGDKWRGGKAEWPLHHGQMGWDADTVDFVLTLPSLAAHCIIWGGHLYELPPHRGWLIWDKVVREFTSGHAEMAWTTLDQPIKAFNFTNGELASEGKVHPTQKPLRLMKWCLGFLPDAQTILDPFMGSGTTGVAAVQMGRDFVGIERDERYFDLACERIRKAQDQGDLFLGEAA